MAEQICRVLRDGAVEGEHAPALTIKDCTHAPLGHFVFNHIFTRLHSYVSLTKSQSKGCYILIALSRSPSFYARLLNAQGDVLDTSDNWLRVLDCYTDPLGWKSKLSESGSISKVLVENSVNTTLCQNVKDLSNLTSKVIELGREMVGEGKERFAVAIDSVSEMLRHAPLSSVAGLLSDLRGHGRCSFILQLLHSDLHEIVSVAALEYISSMLANVEVIAQVPNGQKFNSENLSLIEQNFRRSRFHVRFKRRNGRVRLMSEELSVDQSGIKFVPVSSEELVIAQSLVPKVQFNLQLSEKERDDRAKVVLPFEHQDNVKTTQIYDGRRSLSENQHENKHEAADDVQKTENPGNGEIIYFRDSDDEMPDSDEDPDDDLDI
ncbi:hypothetical protein Leryth_010411 [Lithospermum erythrorhizon]|nr:hypothetical protein Leryth_010411 [Lithospermum erythrorhizon]